VPVRDLMRIMQRNRIASRKDRFMAQPPQSRRTLGTVLAPTHLLGERFATL
jgi:hypothetical protein